MPNSQRSRIKDLAKANKRNFDFSNVAYINYVDTSSVTENKFSIVQRLDCTKDVIPSRAKKAVEKNTIIYSAVRPNLKHYGIIKEPLKHMVVSTGFITLDLFKEIDPNYFYYNITQQKYTDFLHTIAVNNASAYPAINPSDLENLEINVFDDVNTQKSIGNLLYAIDNKIELNNKINIELEMLARALYNYWFVQFDFPDGKGRPYKSSGGKMVYNEVLKREIPEGWKVDSLGNLGVEVIRGVTYNKNDIKKSSDENIIGILRATNINGNEIDLNGLVYVDKSLVSENQKLNPFDILITMSSGSKEHVGKNGLFPFATEVGFGAFCSKIRIDKEYNLFYYLYFQSEQFKNYVKNSCLGTNINNLNNSLILDIQLPSSNSAILANFHALVCPLFTSIISARQESARLTQLRDFLLPMLMNGQVVVI